MQDSAIKKRKDEGKTGSDTIAIFPRPAHAFGCRLTVRQRLNLFLESTTAQTQPLCVVSRISFRS